MNRWQHTPLCPVEGGPSARNEKKVRKSAFKNAAILTGTTAGPSRLRPPRASRMMPQRYLATAIRAIYTNTGTGR